MNEKDLDFSINSYQEKQKTKAYLIKFYEKLLLVKNNNLNSEDLIVKKLFN